MILNHFLDINKESDKYPKEKPITTSDDSICISSKLIILDSLLSSSIDQIQSLNYK